MGEAQGEPDGRTVTDQANRAALRLLHRRWGQAQNRSGDLPLRLHPGDCVWVRMEPAERAAWPCPKLAPRWKGPMQVRLWDDATGTAQLLGRRYRVNQSKLLPANVEGDVGRAGPWAQNPETADVDPRAAIGSGARGRETGPHAGTVDAAADGAGRRGPQTCEAGAGTAAGRSEAQAAGGPPGGNDTPAGGADGGRVEGDSGSCYVDLGTGSSAGTPSS
jgi:hypothetical protein